MFMCAHASNQGGWGGFFTSLLSGCEFLPAQKLGFFPAPMFLKPWMLRARKVSNQVFYGAYPSAVWRLSGIVLSPLLRWKKCASNWHAVALIFFWRDGQFPVVACVEIFEFDRRFCFLQYVVFGDQILAKKIWRKNHERRLRTCNIYTCLFYIERLLYTRDKVTGFKVETSNPTGFLEKQISSE